MTDETTCQGHAFHSSFKSGKASGTFVIHSGGITFHNSQAKVTLPLDGLSCETGGAGDRLVFFSHPLQPGWKLFSSDLSLLENPVLQQVPAILEQLCRMQKKQRTNRGVLVAVLAMLVLLPVLFLANLDLLSAPAARLVPTEWEQKLGEQVLKQYRIQHHFLAQEEADRLLQPLVEPLIQASEDQRFTFRFHINRDEQVNAFALPGGYVVINSGLILKAESAEELLGVLAHEMSHVTEQHGVRNIIGSAGIYLTINAILGDMTGLLAVIADAAPFLVNQRYSRGFETAADEKGAALLLKANVDPRGLASFFEKLKKEEEKRMKEMAGEENSDLAKTALSLISTHPATDDRIAHLEELTSTPQSARFRDLRVPMENLQQAVKEFVTNNEKESYDEG